MEEQAQQEHVRVLPNTTQEFLLSQIKIKDERIANLEEHIQKVTQRSYADSADRNRITEDMQTWTLEALDNGTINEDEALEIAEIVGFELSKEFELDVTVSYSITVNARDEESAQNLIHDIDFDTVQYDSDNISWLSSSVDRIDIQQGATNNKPEHVLKLLLNSPNFSQGACDQYHMCLRSPLRDPQNFPVYLSDLTFVSPIC